MLTFLLALAACASPEDSGDVSFEAPPRFGSVEGDCDDVDSAIHVDVGADVALVRADACPADGRCKPVEMYRIESGSSEWIGSCEPGTTYTVTWVAPS